MNDTGGRPWKAALMDRSADARPAVEAPAVARSERLAWTGSLLTRLSRPMLEAFYGAGYWRSDTIYALARDHAERTPDRFAVRDGRGALTYAELIDLAETIGADLAAAGLQPGDRVAVWISARVEMAAYLLACSRHRFVLCPSLHRNHTVDEVATLLSRVRASALAAERGYGADGERADIFAAAEMLGHIQRIHRLDAPQGAGVDPALGDLAPSTVETVVEPDPDSVVYLAFTSGTTGEPKGVMHSDNTLLSNARELRADWGFGAESVIYTMSPLSHNLGFGALVLSLLSGGELVVHDAPRGARLSERLGAVGATFLFGVPAHAMDLLDELRAGGGGLERLRGFRVSGAAAPAHVVEGLRDFGVIVQSGYGMTEACSHHYTRPEDDPSLVVGSSGRACRNYEIRIFAQDDPDRPLPTGEIGQIGGRGASLMLGYFDNQRATEAAFNRGGWFMTGDLGWVDDAGYVRVTGRIKDVIIRGGHNIYPAHIEALAMRHPSVERAAALPVKDERLGERVCIAVVPRDGGHVDPDQLLEHLDAAGLSKYDMPEYFLELEQIPLSANGKVLKRALVGPLEEGRLTPRPIRFRSRSQ